MGAVPFIVAHRAGNDLESLRRAEALRPRLIEADVHLYAGRLELRHLKTLGPLPLLWDRWYLASPRTPRLQLAALLEGASPETTLMLDLKGLRRSVGRRVREELVRVQPKARVVVCSRSWRLLEPLRDHPEVQIVHSVGSRRQLRALRRRFAGRRLDGVSIHRRLLDAGTVADLRARAGIIMSWPVASAEEARRLAAWGVDGVITERFEELAGA
jgi:glycerophosphoryl diester phosphodiesterase